MTTPRQSIDRNRREWVVRTPPRPAPQKGTHAPPGERESAGMVEGEDKQAEDTQNAAGHSAAQVEAE